MWAAFTVADEFSITKGVLCHDNGYFGSKLVAEDCGRLEPQLSDLKASGE
jgi:hypothetical protein